MSKLVDLGAERLRRAKVEAKLELPEGSPR